MEIKAYATLSLKDLATNLAHQANDGQVVEFLKLLDEKMASWDFTEAAAAMFIGQASRLHAMGNGSHPYEEAGIARVQEYVRQNLLSLGDEDEIIYLDWIHSDSNAKPAKLSLEDLQGLLALAVVGLAHLPKGES